MPKLRLVTASTIAEEDENVRLISEYAAEILYAVGNVRLSGNPEDRLTGYIGHDFVEMWYWYDPIRLKHSIVFPCDSPEPAAYEDQPYFSTPFYFYFFFCGLHLDQITETAVKSFTFFERYLAPTVHGKRASQALDRRIIEQFGSQNVSIPTEDDAGISITPEGEEWTAVLLAMEYFNRLPTVSIARVAVLLGVEEKTIRNRIERGDLEGIRRRGELRVTVRSIKQYLLENYRPSAKFNVWNDVEAALRKKLKTQ